MLLFFVVLLIILILLLRKVNENYFILALCERIKCVEGKPLEEKVCIIPGKTIFGNNFDVLNVTPEEKWHLRRKMLTPAFHFNILQTFNEIFKEESLKLLEKLKHLQHEDVNISDVIDEFSLNNVCETALGVKLNDIDGASEYRAAVHNLSTMIVRRVCNPLIISSSPFLPSEKSALKHFLAFFFRNSYVKTRYAMLDTLLHNEAQGLIDHQGICEEVDTAMFEGYDTTSTCLKFALLNLAQYPDIQKRCYQEIENLSIAQKW
uniref:Cytochrome P450 n=1 Tax=Glossina palpalis gambiensis TaxID=67801 RepID=A0A1B0ASE2_9MUSC